MIAMEARWSSICLGTFRIQGRMMQVEALPLPWTMNLVNEALQLVSASCDTLVSTPLVLGTSS